jgi:cytochrome c-type biogenesis protein CcmH/NrfG
MMWRWRESFAQNPDKAVADLFSGRAGLGVAFRRDLAEILFHEFPDQPAQAADRERLDAALLGWLEAMRRNYPREVARLDFDVYGKRLCDALQALQLLNLPRSIHHIREVHSAWLRWLAPLRLAPERDPALESWRLLSLRQPEEASPAPWLQLAGDHRPEYLSVALLGLQRLPTPEQEKNQVLLAAALLQHYGQMPGDPAQNLPEFKRHLATLRGLYPRGPEHWQKVLRIALDSLEKHLVPPHARQFLDLVGKQGNKPTGRTASQNTICPTPKQNEAVLQAINDKRQDTDSVSQKFLQLVEGYLRFAEHTGDSYFFLRTLRNHGHDLLQRTQIRAADLERIGAFIEDALRWAPNDEYTWTFWADWLAYQGRETHQLWVLREAVRLFPEDKPSRVELARLLISQGEAHWPEAERWLRGVVERYPENEHSRVELARLLIRQGETHWPEAERWLREAVERHPDHRPSRVVLAKLLARTGRSEHGMDLLQTFLRSHPSDAFVQPALRKLQQGHVFSHHSDFDEPAPARQPQAAVNDAPVGATLALLRDKAQHQQDYAQTRYAKAADARRRLQQAAVSGDALAGLYWEWLNDGHTDTPLPPHAWAWQAARCYAGGCDSQNWGTLEQRFPEQWESTRFLRWLAAPDSGLADEITARMRQRQGDADNLAPVEHFALTSWQQLSSSDANPEKRKDIAFAILQAKAEPSLTA